MTVMVWGLEEFSSMKPLILHGHKRPLTCVKVNRDGDLLLTAAKDGILRLWRVADGEPIGVYNCQRAVVWSCDVTHDSRFIISASGDSRIFVFQLQNGRLIAEIKEEGPCKYVEWKQNPLKQNQFVLAHDDFGESVNMAIKVYKLNLVTNEVGQGELIPQVLWVQRNYSARCIQCRWGPLDKEIITCHEDGSINLWDSETGHPIRKIQAHELSLTCISFSKNRLFMLTCSSDKVAKLWDTMNYECVKKYETDRPLNACDISPLFKMEELDGKNHIILGGGQSAEDVTTTTASEGKFQALIYDLIHQDELGSIKGHFGPINALAFLSDGSGYVSGGEDGYVRVYNFDDYYFTDKF